MRDATAAVGALLVLVAALGAAVPAAAGASPSGASDAQAQCSYPLTVTDATGTEVTVEAAPERIVTLSPSAAQTLWEFDAADKVVGVSSNAAYLEGAGDKEVVVDGMTVQTEAVVGLEPDLVLAPDVVADEDVQSLRESGLTVYNFGPTANFSELYEKVRLTGELAGECAAADAVASDMQARVSAIRQSVADEEKPGALYSFFGYTAGENTFIDSIVTSAGTTNVAAEVGLSGFKPISNEVVANQSEAIEWLVFNDTPGSKPTAAVYNETVAVRENQTVTLNTNYLNQPAPRTVRALETLTQAIHPEAYEEAQAALAATPTATATPTASMGTATASPTPTPTATATPTVAEDTPTDPPATTSGDGPGFTAATGLVALLAAVLIVRRR